MIQSLRKDSLSACKEACRSRTNCKVVIFGKAGGGEEGYCGLYKESARLGCSVTEGDIRKFTMYSVCAPEGKYR